MEESVFTKIINGEIPCHKVYEDEATIAFMPLHMMGLAHVLVVPKKQVDEFQDLEEAEYIAVMQTVKKVALRMKQVLQPKRVGLKVVGLDVPHAHIHVIAFNTLDEYISSPDESNEPDHDRLALMAERLRF